MTVQPFDLLLRYRVQMGAGHQRWGDFSQRRQHKRPLHHARMRQRQAR